jgi:addiction module HigA family antidote
MPRDAIHPGEHLNEQLDALEMSAAEFARRIAVPTNRVTELLNGKRAVTADTALRLARAFDTSARFWMNLQVLYDLRVAEAAADKRVRKIVRVGMAPKPAVRRATRRVPLAAAH